MAAPKKKWTQQEEAALVAGVNKHGAGKWFAILNDPEFTSILHLRTNVQLKDKWRTSLGSRDRGRAAAVSEKSQQITKHDTTYPLMDIHKEIENIVVKVASLAIQTRLDDLILEAIVNLKERHGSNKTTIASWIGDQCSPPADFKQLLSDKLEALTASGKLIKVKNMYRMAPTSANPEVKSSKLLVEELRVEINPVLKSQVDAELERMRTMTAREAAVVAARAVAEAEAAMEEAEAATREAEAAEAAAEAAELAYAEATRALVNAAKLD